MAQWRYIGNTTYTNTMPSWLDAVYTLGTKSTYYDGSVRTQGSGQAGTYSRYQNNGVTEAVYATPAVDTLNVRYIWAGSSSTPSPSPTMATPDAYTINHAFASIAKNAGAFNAWNNAQPFTSGQFFGYWKAGWTTSDGAGTLHMWECESAVYYISTVGNNTRHGCLGAWLKPGSTEAADAESDGKLYGVMTSGSAANIGSFWSIQKTSTNAAWFGHNTGSNRQHSAVFLPGQGTLVNCYVNTAFSVTSQQTTQVLPSGKFSVLADSMPVIKTVSPQYMLGVLDSISPFSNAISGQVLADSGASKDVGYVVGKQTNSATECALLLRNEP